MADRAMSWHSLMELTAGKRIVIEKVRLVDSGIAIEGRFEPTVIANLDSHDLAFLGAFVRSHGSIKQMEKLFGVSYPTIKNRLNQLGEKFDFVEVLVPDERMVVLEMVDRGEITVNEAIERLNELKAPSADEA